MTDETVLCLDEVMRIVVVVPVFALDRLVPLMWFIAPGRPDALVCVNALVRVSRLASMNRLLRFARTSIWRKLLVERRFAARTIHAL